MDTGAPPSSFSPSAVGENRILAPHLFSVSFPGFLSNLPAFLVPVGGREFVFAVGRRRRLGSERPARLSQFMDSPLDMYFTVWPRTRPGLPSVYGQSGSSPVD